MPKIPFRENADLIQHRNLVVHASGGPDRNFNMENAESLIRIGTSIRSAGQNIGSAVSKFAEQKISTENKLAATQARNLYRSMQDDLRKRMADNPGQIEHFQEWETETDRNYAEAETEFTNRMSPQYRKLFETEMNALRKHSLNEREYIVRQAITQKNYDLFQTQWKDAALRGDLDECKRLLEEHRGTLISEQEYQQKLLDYDRLSAFGAVKREVEAGTPGIVSRLKERDSMGIYKNYSGLEESARDRFIRFAEAEETRREAETDQKVLAALADGNILYPDDILKKKHQEGTLSDRQYHTYKGWYDSYRAKEKRAADYQANAKEKAAKATRQQQLDRLFSLIGYDENGFSKTLDDSAFSDAFGKIKKICGNDYSLYSDSMQKLNSIRTKDLSFRKTALYKDGDGILSQWKKSGRMAAEGWWGRDAADTSDEAKFFVERAMRMDLENFCLEHPKASTKELYDYLNGRLQTYNALKLEKIITSGGKSIQKAVENANPYKDITVTVPPGWRFKGGDPSKEENWERTATK